MLEWQFLALARIWVTNIQCLFQWSKCFLHWLCCISTTKEPAKFLWVVTSTLLVLWFHFELNPLPTSCPPPPTLCEHPSFIQLIKFSILFGSKLSTSSKKYWECFQGNKMMHLLCKFHTHTHNPWLVVMSSNHRNCLSLNFQCVIWNGFPNSSYILDLKKNERNKS